MRTATKFIIGNDYGEFVAVLKNYFPAGKLAIVCQDKLEGEKLARLLGKDFNTLVFTSDAETSDMSAVRFVIGLGGSGVIPVVKRLAKRAKYAFIPSVFDYRFLYPFDGEFTLPEFVFLSRELREEKNYLARLYQTVFQLYSELVFSAFYTRAFPYRDGTVEAYMRVAESILGGKLDRDAFYGESLRFVTNAVNELYARGTESSVTERAAQIYGVTVGERFILCRFLLLMLKNFTKHSFRGILLPSEKPILGVRAVSGGLFDGSILPSDEMLETYCGKMSFLTDMPEPDIGGMLKALSQSAEGNPIFSIINNEGITDALYYEKSEGNLGVFV